MAQNLQNSTENPAEFTPVNPKDALFARLDSLRKLQDQNIGKQKYTASNFNNSLNNSPSSKPIEAKLVSNLDTNNNQEIKFIPNANLGKNENDQQNPESSNFENFENSQRQRKKDPTSSSRQQSSNFQENPKPKPPNKLLNNIFNFLNRDKTLSGRYNPQKNPNGVQSLANEKRCKPR